tara:strand:+ start:452 stop:727 length:276 start_codon:yes stop_codon:yes gene_type:complete
MNNGILDEENKVTIHVYPSPNGFACSVVERQLSQMNYAYSIALTIAHGMVKRAIENPDKVFDDGMESLANPLENNTVDFDTLHKKREKRLN